MIDPYVILNVKHDATDDEIRQAYRRLAKKYHPDRCADKKLSEKMKEINNAYHTLMKNRREGISSVTESENKKCVDEFRRMEIDELISSAEYDEAEKILNSVMPTERDAGWYYHMANVSYYKGWLEESYNYAETACRMESDNEEYNSFYEKISAERHSSYSDMHNVKGTSGGCIFCGFGMFF